MDLDASLLPTHETLPLGLRRFPLRNAQIPSSAAPDGFLRHGLALRVSSVHQDPTRTSDVSFAVATAVACEISGEISDKMT